MLKINLFLSLMMFAFLGSKAADGNLQIINLSPDSSMNLVEVSIGDSVLIDSLSFNEATAYLTIPEGNGQTLKFKSVTYPTEIFELANIDITASSYFQSILYGVTNTGDYVANPDGNNISLNATYNAVDTSGISSDDMRVNFFHGSSDLNELDVADFIFEYIVDDMSFGMYSSSSTDLPDSIRNLFFTTTDSVVTVASRTIDLRQIDGKTITVFVSGFLVSGDNSDGPDFGVYAVDEAGNVIVLDVISDVFVGELVTDLQLAPNPASQYTTIRFNNTALSELNVTLIDIAGRQIQTTSYQAQNGFNQIGVQLPNVSSGLYYLVLESQGSVQALPLVITK